MNVYLKLFFIIYINTISNLVNNNGRYKNKYSIYNIKIESKYINLQLLKRFEFDWQSLNSSLIDGGHFKKSYTVGFCEFCR